MLYIMLLLSVANVVTSDVIQATWGQIEGPESLPQLPHFWTSSGLSPDSAASGGTPTLLSGDECTSLALIGSLPHGALTHVRIHWLLDLVQARLEGDDIQFDFYHLDFLLAWMNQYGLSPGLELMGNPSGVFSDLGEAQQQRWWQQLVANLAARYIDIYGLKAIKQWRFETWNEPDLRMYNTLNFTIKSFETYFWTSVEGLRIGSRGTLLLGGPAGLFRTPRVRHPLCWGLLDAVARRTDAHDRLSFISFHRKGNGTSRLILQDSLELVRIFRRRYPTLQHLPLANDEADPLTGWWRSEVWRADVRYAAMMARTTIDHLGVMVRQSHFPLRFLSNDNAFLSTSPNFFTQRTLLARFQMNDTQPPHTQFFLKPVCVILALMSLLGNRELPLSIVPPDPRVALLAAATWHRDMSLSAAVLIVFNDETLDDPTFSQQFNLTLPISEWSPAGLEARFSVFILDNERTNPSAMWQRAGSPSFPDPVLRRTMRRAQEPYRLVLSKSLPASGEIWLRLHLPSVALVQLCTRPVSSPGQVTRLHALEVTFGEVLLLWSDTHVATRCLLRYEVEFQPDHQNAFHRINLNQDSILLSYHHQSECKLSGDNIVRGQYRVRAVDLWNQEGQFSPILHYAGETENSIS